MEARALKNPRDYPMYQATESISSFSVRDVPNIKINDPKEKETSSVAWDQAILPHQTDEGFNPTYPSFLVSAIKSVPFLQWLLLEMGFVVFLLVQEDPSCKYQNMRFK